MDHHVVEDRSVEVRAVAAAFVSVAFITVTLRCYVRGYLVKAFGWDDVAMVVASIFYVMFSACMIAGSIWGTGRRYRDLTEVQRVTAMRYWWLCEIAYCFSSVIGKISICIFLLRITIHRTHRWILYTVLFLTVIAGLVFMLLLLLQCKPMSYAWTQAALDPTIRGHCLNTKIIISMTYVYSTFAAMCDFTVGILPIFLVKNLHMKRQTKIAVAAILSMACMASSAVIIRIPFVHTFADPDFLYATVELAIWSNVEVGLGITAGSLATLRPLFRHWLGSRTTATYPSPFPGLSGSRAPGRGSSGQPFPLRSLDDSDQSRLRPDKLAITVTTVLSQEQNGSWHGPSSSNESEERLTGLGSSVRPAIGGDMGLGIHQTFEVMQTSTPQGSETVREHL
ncbi:hypothetical protein BDV28DRAFT_154241 [Aspergillus coremiiformis]|uniref:Rhodopsin domain-containing protein n=1 Tax=Aspergillus coremiiformis TaxID=138285 RepID=A0A5N6ZHD7_9EURO|nr:hypothetical protein BDV28DRAFT_154241 [Aspergillus coremiiformis]